jgi:hypothetical protein
MHRLRNILISTTIVVLVTLSGQTTRAGANFGSTDRIDCGYTEGGASNPSNCVSLANNSTHALRPLSLGDQWPGVDVATQFAIDSIYNPTDLTVYTSNTDPSPDVWALDGFYGQNGVFAWVDCPSGNSGTGGAGSLQWCRGQTLNYNASLLASYPTGLGGLNGLACHELGHTIGLRHNTHPTLPQGATSCTRTFPPYPANINAHEINDHINPNY